MSAAAQRVEHGGGLATTSLLALSTAVFGLLGSLPSFSGPAIGIAGVLVSTVLRAADRKGRLGFSVAPALIAIALLAVTAPAVPAAELFGGLTGLAFLLWLADDPARPSGGGRRAAATIALAAVAVGLAWAVGLVLPTRTAEIGLAAALLTGALVLLALLLGRPQAIRGAAHRNA